MTDPTQTLAEIRERVRVKPEQFLNMRDIELSLEDARTLLAALDAVLAVHRKSPIYETESGMCEHGDECEAVELSVGMSMCPDSVIAWTCEECAEWTDDEFPDWPCPTVQAVHTALDAGGE